jgi:hypothetical protein
MIKIKKPMKIHDVFSDEKFLKLKSLFSKDKVKSFDYQSGFSRYVTSDNNISELKNFANDLIPMARQLFESKNLLPTYTLFSHYEGPQASLYKHKDDNACTYTIDMCVYQKYAWDLWIENQPYNLLPNEAVAYYGNDQEHWREEFPMKDTNHVAMIFFHFAEPDHWYFTKGPSYLNVIRKETTLKEWASKINQ